MEGAALPRNFPPGVGVRAILPWSVRLLLLGVNWEHLQGTAEKGFLASLLEASPLQPIWPLSQGHPQLPEQHPQLRDCPQMDPTGRNRGAEAPQLLLGQFQGGRRLFPAPEPQQPGGQSGAGGARSPPRRGTHRQGLVAAPGPRPKANGHLGGLPGTTGLWCERGGSAPTRPPVMG